jgi:hypothetical protein
MMNFSTFFPGSEGLVISAGLAPPFSEAGFAAHNIPKPKRRATEMMRKIRIDLLNFDFIVPSNSENEPPSHGENG